MLILRDHNFVFSGCKPFQMLRVKGNNAPVNSDISEGEFELWDFAQRKHTQAITNQHLEEIIFDDM